MQNRLKQIRKYFKLNQEDFGKRIGAKQSTITAYECGNRVPMDVTISAICREFGIDETWLRTGEGEMLRPRSKADEIAEITNTAMERTAEDARNSLAAHLAKLTDAEVILLAELLERMQGR